MDTKKLRQKILDLAIRGKLVPQDPNDEPASVLIEKIRTEKEQLIKEKKIKRDKNESYIYRSDTSYYEQFADGTVKCIDEEIPFEIPESWEWCYLDAISANDLGKTLDKVKNRGEYHPYLRSVNVRWGKISLDDLKEMKFEDEEINQYRIEKDDLLICEGGEVGRCAVWSSNDNILYQNALHRVRFYANINPYFYMYVLHLYNDLQVLEKHSRGVTIKHLTKSSLNKIPLPLPPLKEQIRIVNSIERYSDVINVIEDNQTDLQQFVTQTKSKILDLAIRGKLVPQDPNDEPASALLERIKAEHPESKKKPKNTSDNSHYQNLPQGWIECTLENIGSWSSGATPSRSNKMYYTNGTVNWLKTGDLNDGYIDDIPEKITDFALKECSVRLNPKGSVLIAMYGATIGKIGILNVPATTNQACCTCITYTGIYNKFLFYLLMSSKKILQMKAEGGAQPNISKEKIISFSILLPPTQEQVRIVQAVESLLKILDGIAAEL